MKKKTLIILISTIILTGCILTTYKLLQSSSDSDQEEATIEAAETIEEIQESNSGDHEDPSDYIWDEADVITVTLNENSISVEGDGTRVNGSQVTITSAGTYRFSGDLADGQIVVDCDEKDTVRLILNNVDIKNSTSAPIYIENSEKTIVILDSNSTNYITDTDSYVFENSENQEPNAAIFSTSDLTIYGIGGILTVTGNYNDAIASKDGLIIKEANIDFSAKDDGIRGKDYLIVRNGNITGNANGDGLKADNADDEESGYVAIEQGVININANGDAITAVTDVLISNGDMTLTSGGGNTENINSDASAKGIKAEVSIIIDNGNITIDSADDAIHSNNNISISGGIFEIASGDDAFHADEQLVIDNGDFNITTSYEGLESKVITINNGDFNITSSDDGLNIAGGNDESGMMGRGGPDSFNDDGSQHLHINGGYIFMNAAGDGADVNGSIIMTDGTLIINGPTSNANGALDYDGSFEISGGLLIAVGSSGMALAPSTSSSQYSTLINLTSSQNTGQLIHIENSKGEEILTFAPSKKYQSIAFSCPELEKGETYEVWLGGSSTGTQTNGLYKNGSYTAGSQYTRFTISSMVTSLGKANNQRF